MLVNAKDVVRDAPVLVAAAPMITRQFGKPHSVFRTHAKRGLRRALKARTSQEFSLQFNK